MHSVTSNAVAKKFSDIIVTGVVTANISVGYNYIHVQFPKTYTIQPLIFANIYDSAVVPYSELTGVNTANVNTQGFDIRVYNSYSGTLSNIKICWLAIPQ